MIRNHYTVLDVDPNATQEQIRNRFLELARQQHPDRFRGEEKSQAEARFQAITEAFNVLSNPGRRRQHDQELAQPQIGTRGKDPVQLARVYLQRGTQAYREGNYRSAAESFDRATREEPGNAQAWLYLARACSLERRWLGRATRAIVKACELEPMNASFLKLAGDLFVKAQMPLRAEKYYRRALQWSGRDDEVQQALDALTHEGPSPSASSRDPQAKSQRPSVDLVAPKAR